MKFTIEIDLLVEIEDIEDELRILHQVLEDQQTTVKQLSDTFGNVGLEQGIPLDHKSIKSYLLHVGKMQDMAKKARDSLHHLIDLKQKQANSLEVAVATKHAEYQRNQAQEAARQSKILMVFTVVTTVFLPL
ncbi:hypothetical protein PT974_05363 [Cladobotryum mycophilum]|uniref:Uncharacterized protein n=1 Tax=Cladobotryum mycophilum TaxID=491253 RepID=A0ABR0SIK6_9HYPO